MQIDDNSDLISDDMVEGLISDFPTGEGEESAAPGARAGQRVSVRPAEFGPLPLGGESAGAQSIDLLLDVALRVSVELGRATMTIKNILALGPGAVIELDKLAGEAVDIMVNDRLIARGEVVVVDENFGVRVTDIVSTARRSQAIA